MAGARIGVDARGRAELSLRTPAMILERMREGVLLIDAAGRIEFANQAFARMLGNDAAALAGTEALGLLQASAGGAGGTLLLRRADGAQLAAEILPAEIEPNGERKTLCVVHDLAERERRERELTEIARLERQRLGGELHDGLGQELTGIALLLRGLSQALRPAAPELLARLEEVIGIANHAIQSARKITVELSPVIAERGGLAAALESLGDWARTNCGIEVRLRLGERAALALDEATATHLTLIAREAIENACAHGRARTATLTLRVHPLFVSLSIVDDGARLPETASESASLGLQIMQHRAGAIGAALRIERRRNGGTRVRCLCPRPVPL